MKNYLDSLSLKGKVVYLVGGLGLIGSEITMMMAKAGGKVVILDIDDAKGSAFEEVITKTGQDVHYENFDVTDLENTETNIDKLLAKYNTMDVWINATYPRSKDWARPLDKMTVEYLRENVDLHLNSYLWTSRKAALAMKERMTKGSIINFGSIYGVLANDLRMYEGTAMAGEITYCAIKSGVINLTRYLASHFGRDGIRANSICPGGIWDHQDETFVKRYEGKVPMGRMGRPEDVAPVALYLASEASSYVSGETIMVDGGWTAV